MKEYFPLSNINNIPLPSAPLPPHSVAKANTQIIDINKIEENAMG